MVSVSRQVIRLENQDTTKATVRSFAQMAISILVNLMMATTQDMERMNGQKERYMLAYSRKTNQVVKESGLGRMASKEKASGTTTGTHVLPLNPITVP